MHMLLQLTTCSVWTLTSCSRTLPDRRSTSLSNEITWSALPCNSFTANSDTCRFRVSEWQRCSSSELRVLVSSRDSCREITCKSNCKTRRVIRTSYSHEVLTLESLSTSACRWLILDPSSMLPPSSCSWASCFLSDWFSRSNASTADASQASSDWDSTVRSSSPGSCCIW